MTRRTHARRPELYRFLLHCHRRGPSQIKVCRKHDAWVMRRERRIRHCGDAPERESGCVEVYGYRVERWAAPVRVDQRAAEVEGGR